ncbi:MAG: TM2 domain-containing protein [Acidiferrobacter sp.]
MKKAWTQWNFEGHGLQSLNLELHRRLRHVATAYGLWFLFPLGLHALYLGERRRVAAAVAASVALVMIILWAPRGAMIAAIGLYLAFALYDLGTLDRRVIAYNKALRIRLTMGAPSTAPVGYRGRYSDDDVDLADYLRIKDQERGGHPSQPTTDPTPSTPGRSFRDQEAALRAHIARHRPPKTPRS